MLTVIVSMFPTVELLFPGSSASNADLGKPCQTVNYRGDILPDFTLFFHHIMGASLKFP